MTYCRLIPTKVVGVTKGNRTDRQNAIRQCEIGERLKLVPNPKNRYDPNAIEVRRQNGKQLGHIRASLAEEFTSNLKKGYRYEAFVLALTGPGADNILGCNIGVVVLLPGVTEDQYWAFCEAELRPRIKAEQANCVAISKMVKSNSGCAGIVLFVAGLSGCAFGLFLMLGL